MMLERRRMTRWRHAAVVVVVSLLPALRLLAFEEELSASAPNADTNRERNGMKQRNISNPRIEAKCIKTRTQRDRRRDGCTDKNRERNADHKSTTREKKRATPTDTKS